MALAAAASTLVLAALQNALAAARLPVLTVGETAAFVQHGGALALLRQDSRIVFDINMAVVTRAGLRVSPQMLRLARDVVGGQR